jgi:hypothetical protein
MIQRALTSKGIVAYVLACATAITLYFRWPLPRERPNAASDLDPCPP